MQGKRLFVMQGKRLSMQGKRLSMQGKRLFITLQHIDI
jgi:hypothetical protein